MVQQSCFLLCWCPSQNRSCWREVHPPSVAIVWPNPVHILVRDWLPIEYLMQHDALDDKFFSAFFRGIPFSCHLDFFCRFIIYRHKSIFLNVNFMTIPLFFSPPYFMQLSVISFILTVLIATTMYMFHYYPPAQHLQAPGVFTTAYLTSLLECLISTFNTQSNLTHSESEHDFPPEQHGLFLYFNWSILKTEELALI